MEIYSNLRQGEKGAWISIGAYVILSVLKLTIGFLGSSDALKADGLNNTTDIIASIAVLIGLRISQRPPDKNHRYGHLRSETVASLVASFIMAMVGLHVLGDAIQSFWVPDKEAPSGLTAIVAFFSAIVMYFVYLYNIRLSKRINSTAVKAAAYDNRSDAWVSIGTSIGIVGAIYGFPIIDTVTAFIIGVLIIKTAVDIFKDSVLTLTDGFDEEMLDTISETADKVEGVTMVKDVKCRAHGSMIFVDLTVTMDHTLTVAESHRITEEIEDEILKINPHSFLQVHTEPDYM
ncbi:cation diffusion facilitator family transporter [Chungangia koreensis]|uniref:Cation diffusion facilitator family transporter n=1 Tax=Chungangia koreensis TaxID=752657 RepID=A0ABV8X6M6_9LACT